MKPALLVAVAALAAAACAPPPAAPGPQASAPEGVRQCFNANAVNGFRNVDRDTVDLTVGAGRVFRLELAGVCDVDFARGIAVQTRGGSGFVCGGHDAEIIVPTDAGGPRVCTATSVRQLSEAEAQASRR